MKPGRHHLLLSVALFLCGCSTGTIHLKNQQVAIEVIPIVSETISASDTAWAQWFDHYRCGGEIRQAPRRPYPGGGEPEFTMHLAIDDSVSMFYEDLHGSIIGEPIRAYVRKGTYRVAPVHAYCPNGIYVSHLIIGSRHWSKKAVLLR
jgi:hypothetical protein